MFTGKSYPHFHAFHHLKACDIIFNIIIMWGWWIKSNRPKQFRSASASLLTWDRIPFILQHIKQLSPGLGPCVSVHVCTGQSATTHFLIFTQPVNLDKSHGKPFSLAGSQNCSTNQHRIVQHNLLDPIIRSALVCVCRGVHSCPYAGGVRGVRTNPPTGQMSSTLARFFSQAASRGAHCALQKVSR